MLVRAVLLTAQVLTHVISLNVFPYITVPGCWILGPARFNAYATASQARKAITANAPSQVACIETLERHLQTALKCVEFSVA